MTMLKNKMNSFLYGGNAPYVEEQYELYLADPATVSEDWREYFDALRELPAVDGTNADDVAHGAVIDRFVTLAKSGVQERIARGGGLTLASWLVPQLPRCLFGGSRLPTWQQRRLPA